MFFCFFLFHKYIEMQWHFSLSRSLARTTKLGDRKNIIIIYLLKGYEKIIKKFGGGMKKSNKMPLILINRSERAVLSQEL